MRIAYILAEFYGEDWVDDDWSTDWWSGDKGWSHDDWFQQDWSTDDCNQFGQEQSTSQQARTSITTTAQQSVQPVPPQAAPINHVQLPQTAVNSQFASEGAESRTYAFYMTTIQTISQTRKESLLVVFGAAIQVCHSKFGEEYPLLPLDPLDIHP